MILIVDDHADIRRILKISLKKAGFQTEEARNGEEAIEKAVANPPQLILLDVMMPRMDGFEACKRMREIDSLKNIPVIFLTALEEESDILKGYEFGAEDYLIKPVRHAFLIAKIRAILARQQREQIKSITNLRPGMLLVDRYKIIGELGRGGMGVVFEVEHVGLNIKMALKAMRSEETDPAKARERFQRETEALAKLDHPNLIKVHDSGLIGDLMFYTMDLLPGGCLYERIDENGPLPVAEALDTTVKIAAAVQCAHDKGIMHRDLKTDNVMYSEHGEPIVTDFSLVINIRQEQSRLTTHGIILGTPHYMSPEQVRDPRDVDGRSDVYCMGILLYEMLTAQTPHHEATEMEAMVKIMLEDVPSPKHVMPELPDIVVDVCMKALRRKRADRYQSAQEFSDAAARALEQLQLQ